MIEYFKEPFRAGGINDLAMYMGDLSAMLTFIYFVKSDYLGFGFWFSWALFWLPT